MANIGVPSHEAQFGPQYIFFENHPVSLARIPLASPLEKETKTRHSWIRRSEGNVTEWIWKAFTGIPQMYSSKEAVPCFYCVYCFLSLFWKFGNVCWIYQRRKKLWRLIPFLSSFVTSGSILHTATHRCPCFYYLHSSHLLLPRPMLWIRDTQLSPSFKQNNIIIIFSQFLLSYQHHVFTCRYWSSWVWAHVPKYKLVNNSHILY